MGTLCDCAPCALSRGFLMVENRLLREVLVRLFRKRSDLLVVGRVRLST